MFSQQDESVKQSDQKITNLGGGNNSAAKVRNDQEPENAPQWNDSQIKNRHKPSDFDSEDDSDLFDNEEQQKLDW